MSYEDPLARTASVMIIYWARLLSDHGKGSHMDSYWARPPKSDWRRPSYCAGGECAEIAELDGMIALRSSTAPGSVVRYTTEEWRALVRAIRAGEFADLG
jgi:hypothetical protein